MKRFVFKIEERSVGVVEVYANSEDEARELAEEYEGMLHIKESDITVGDLMHVED